VHDLHRVSDLDAKIVSLPKPVADPNETISHIALSNSQLYTRPGVGFVQAFGKVVGEIEKVVQRKNMPD